jgi:TetR/AcrR family transcriptional regulator, mexJK operon transcriptional repressor
MRQGSFPVGSRTTFSQVLRSRNGGGRSLSPEKRAQIIDAGKAAFLTQGFGAANVDDIAAGAGVSKMTVYRHFRSKELLFAGVIDALCRQIMDGDLERLLVLPPKAALPKFARRFIDITFAKETVELHRIVVAECRRFPELGRLFYRSGPEPCIDMLEQYLRRHRSAVRLRHSTPRRLAEEFLDLVRGYPHLRVLLGVDGAPSRREMNSRIAGAVRHVLG